MSVRFGIVGTNFISDQLLDAVRKVPEAEVCAVYSRRQETGEVFALKHNIPNIYTDYESFLESDIDAVYIATPIYIHCEQALAAMRHGKHVLCEKIMAVNVREVQEMIDSARAHDVVLLEAMRPDFDPAIELLEKNLEKIGTLRRVTLEYCQYSRRYDRFKEGEILNAFNPDLSNAAIMDIGVYPIHVGMRLFGRPKVIKALCTKLSNGFEGDGMVMMQYDGLLVEAVYSKITQSVNQSVFLGEKGAILLDSVGKPSKMEIHYQNGEKEVIPYTAPANNMIYEVQKFVELAAQHQINHPYLQYTLDTAAVVDEARAQNGIVFRAD